MGKSLDDSDLLDRVRVWTKKSARDRSPDKDSHALTALDPPTTSKGDKSNDTSKAVADHVINEKDQNANNKSEPSNEKIGKVTSGTESNGVSETSRNTSINKKKKPPLPQRFKAGCIRFILHTRDALCHSWFNVLLVFVPVGIIMRATHQSPVIVFAVNAIAIIPLANLLVYATESIASRLGDTLGALLNVSFGNAVELIIYIIALVKNEIRIVQASLLGSILSNLLLIMGMAFLYGGLRYREQVYNNTVTQMSACLLSLSVISLILPTAFHASYSDSDQAGPNTLKLSRATSVVLLIIYILYLLFQLKSHSYLYASTPQHIIDEESHPGILAEILDSSTSSESSSSSSSDSDTSGSHTTSRRIRRAFRNRRRRKSSASSINTASVPSVISSPSFEIPPATPSAQEISEALNSGPSRRTSSVIPSTNADDADHEGQPRIRDFGGKTKENSIREKFRKNKDKRKRHRHHHHRHHKEDQIEEESAIIDRGLSRKEQKQQQQEQVIQPQSEPVDEPVKADVKEQETNPKTDSVPRKGLGFVRFQSQSGTILRPALTRPALPKMLTENVFVQPLPAPQAAPSQVPPATAPHTLRRTSSLPDRLNNQPAAIARRLPINPYAGPAIREVIHPDRQDDDDEPVMSRTSATVLLLITTALVAVCAEFLVDAIPGMLVNSNVGQEFIGLIILPIVSNAAEHFTAVTVAGKNKMDLSIGVSVGSSIQIALFITPLIVIIGWIIGNEQMTLFFNLFETVAIFVTVFVVNFLVLDGRSNYLEGALLSAAYIIIAVAAFYFPSSDEQSIISGGTH